MNAIKLRVRLLPPLAALLMTMSAPPAYAANPSNPELHYYATSLVRYAAKRSNVRAGPETSYRKVGLLEVGDQVRVMAKTGSWFKLEPKRGQQERFVYAPLLSASRPGSGTGAATTAASSALTTRTITDSAGGRYHGQVRDGKRHGHGVYTWANGNRYEGQWRDGTRTGRGVFTWPSGDRYEGDFVDGERTGRGVYTWANGNRYEGQWRDGTRTGRGVFTWPSGGRYEGDFVDGERTGRGVYTWAEGNRWEGKFVDGKKTGRGTRTFADGDSYTEEWRGGKSYDIHRPQSTCLYFERVKGSLAYWTNRCSVGIDMIWRDEGACQSRPGNKYPCGWFVGANKKVTASVDGQGWWYECESPGGIGDVLAIEKRGAVYCIGDATPRTQASKKRQRHGTQQALASARAAADAEHAREEAERRRREEEMERMRVAERQRREAEMWNQIHQHRQRTLQNIRIMTGDTQNQNSGTGSSRCRTSWGGVCNTD